ncbi:MAG: hypothetical protein MJY98_07405 [Fibrobacter sp.]|nr:hypothetical protein [Fibrobacter sp.]
MKKIIALSITLSAVATFFTACGNNATDNYVGQWQGESNMIFEVLSENNQNFIIRNVNGDLTAQKVDSKICGKNTLDMEYCMTVKGDSAYYEFGGITTGYKRISKEKYDEIFATQKKATIQ